MIAGLVCVYCLQPVCIFVKVQCLLLLQPGRTVGTVACGAEDTRPLQHSSSDNYTHMQEDIRDFLISIIYIIQKTFLKKPLKAFLNSG